jgi:hypothetical protein
MAWNLIDEGLTLTKLAASAKWYRHPCGWLGVVPLC